MSTRGIQAEVEQLGILSDFEIILDLPMFVKIVQIVPVYSSPRFLHLSDTFVKTKKHYY